MEATLTGGAAVPASARRFHLLMAGIFVLIAFGGFIPSYWLRLANGSIHVPPIIHVHGFLLFSWTVFYFFQAALISSGRTVKHQAWGLAGIALFTLLCSSIIATQATVLKLDDAHGLGDASRRFSAVVLLGLIVMIGMFAAAIANVRKPEVHKRLMLVLMAGMMTPAIARVFIALLAPPGAADGPPPPFVAVPPGFVAMLLIVAAIIYDWRTRGRPHKAYIYGGLVTLAELLLLVPISGTHAWMSVATFVEHLAG
jgi:hypothetical protein